MNKVFVIAALDMNNGIGKDNTIPWRLSEDMLRFKDITLYQAVIMGRKTLDSFPNGDPLPDRVNIVVTRDKNWSRKGVRVFHDLDSALAYAKSLMKNVFIIGGEEIYKQALLDLSIAGKVNELLITRINHSFNCNKFFPAIDSEWYPVETVTRYSNTLQCEYSFIHYRQIRSYDCHD